MKSFINKQQISKIPAELVFEYIKFSSETNNQMKSISNENTKIYTKIKNNILSVNAKVDIPPYISSNNEPPSYKETT